MYEILSSSKSTLLKTSLDEEMFAKTKFSNLLEETGTLVVKVGENEFDFSPWKFSGTKSDESDVYFEGDRFEGATISSLLMKANDGSNEDGETARKALSLLVEVYTYALEAKPDFSFELPCSGVYGILYGSSDGKESLVFVPEKTFDKCAANLGKESYSIMQEPWRDSALKGKEALTFSRAVACYFALTKKLPYPPKSTDKSVDISYKNFVPLEYALNGVDENLAAIVNENLSGKIGKATFPLSKFKEELFSPEKRVPQKSAEEFERARNEFMAKKEKSISARKKFNRTKGTILASFVAAIFIAVFMLNAFLENSKKPTTIGLSSSETAAVFYQGIHHMDTDLMLASAKDCPEAQGYISRIPQIYVVANMKSAFNFESGISTPENWLFFEPGSSRAYSHFVYGVTNFTIDGKSDTLNNPIPQIRNHKPRLKKEDGLRLDDYSRKAHSVHYWLVHTVDDELKIEEFTTKVNLKWVKNKWQISFLDEVSSSQMISPALFAADYKEALENFEQDQISASNAIRQKYPWIPSEKSISEEAARLESIGY